MASCSKEVAVVAESICCQSRETEQHDSCSSEFDFNKLLLFTLQGLFVGVALSSDGIKFSLAGQPLPVHLDSIFPSSISSFSFNGTLY